MRELTSEDWIKIRTCKWCGNLIKSFFKGSVSTYLYTENGIKTLVLCSEKCKNEYENQFFIEKYKGIKIYNVCGRYIPSFGTRYWFESIEDCRKRIDNRNIGFYI